MTRILGLVAALAILWWILSGVYSPLLLGLGAASAILVGYLAHRMRLVEPEDFPTRLKLLRLPLYVLWLAGQIVRSNIDVSWRILKGGRSISPTVLRVRSSQRSRLGQVVYANSITLTPGTVAINVWENEIRVHALTRESAELLKQGEMDARVSALESGTIG